ncbi:hypothetical protein BJ546DRAFT_650099 [Cryomyces antarcticus]
MRTGMARLMESAEYSDLTLTCHGREFKVHRAVLCPRSSVIAAACDGQLKEANTRTLSVENFDQATVQRMLSYLYTSDYDSGFVNSDAESSKELVKDREGKHELTTIGKPGFTLVNSPAMLIPCLILEHLQHEGRTEEIKKLRALPNPGRSSSGVSAKCIGGRRLLRLFPVS